MGRKKKQFIDKSKAQHFHVVHRSQRDEEKVHAEDFEAPSEFVLMPSMPLNELKKLRKEQKEARKWYPSLRERSGENLKGKDHINELGLPNDGYDYSKHMKQIGGGTFVSRTGQIIRNNPYPEEAAPGAASGDGAGGLVLPEGVLAGPEVERQLEGITLSNEAMDPDLYAALFENDDDEAEAGGTAGGGAGGGGGAFEELLDDFVVEASRAAPEEAEAEEAFDYEAHIARLMEKSRRTLGDFNDPGARGEGEEGEPEALEELGEGEEFDWGPGGGSGELVEGMAALGLGATEDGPFARKTVPELRHNERAMLDAQFEQALLEYNSDSGEEDYDFQEGTDNEDEDSEDDEENSRAGFEKGKLDIENPNALLEGVLDEFLHDQRYDHGLSDEEEGPMIKKTSKTRTPSTAVNEESQQPLNGDERGEGAGAAAAAAGGNWASLQQKYKAPGAAAAKKKLSIRDLGRGGGLPGIREGAPAGEGDEGGGGPFLPGGGGGGGEGEGAEDPLRADPRSREEQIDKIFEALPFLRRRQEAEWDCDTIISTYTNLDNHPTVLSVPAAAAKKKKIPSNILTEAQNPNETQRIVLSRKTGIPLGVLPSRTKQSEAEEDLEGEEETTNKGTARKKAETKEEKKARKAKIKQERKERRQDKKLTKNEYRSDEVTKNFQKNSTQGGQIKTSVFKY